MVHVTNYRPSFYAGRVADPSSLSTGLWSWNSSNFHVNDSLGSEYFDPNHEPQYDLSGYSASEIQVTAKFRVDTSYISHDLLPPN